MKIWETCSFYSENTYAYIPKSDVVNVLENNTGVKKTTQNEIIHILKMILEQNYFQFDQQYYSQTEGLAMGAPTSKILAEVYIQYIWSINDYNQFYCSEK
jgi:hypothetical protein